MDTTHIKAAIKLDLDVAKDYVRRLEAALAALNDSKSRVVNGRGETQDDVFRRVTVPRRFVPRLFVEKTLSDSPRVVAKELIDRAVEVSGLPRRNVAVAIRTILYRGVKRKQFRKVKPGVFALR